MTVFVILHYKNISDTLDCIKSINNSLSGEKYKIVVVDNASGIKKDVKTLSKLDIDLIVNEQNLGFAKGNNIGCEYAVKNYKPDFLCVINSDTEIKQTDFIKKIKKIYEEYNFDILGPKIITYNGDSVNPFPAYKTVEEVEVQIKKADRLINIYGNVVLRNALKIYMAIKHAFVKHKRLENGAEVSTGVSLHGCALIFSKKYMKRYKDIFYNGTFLFHEEEFLEQRRERDNLITVYSPEIELIHKEGRSLDKNFGNDYYQKLIFRNKEIKSSLIKLLDVMKKGKE